MASTLPCPSFKLIGELKMDEKEKTVAAEIFKICRAMSRISGSYYQEQIDKSTFLELIDKQTLEFDTAMFNLQR